MLLWMKFGWVPDSSYNVILTFSLVGALLECRGGWGKSSSVGVLWYDSLPWDVFFFISNFCATSWVTKSLMVFLLMFFRVYLDYEIMNSVDICTFFSSLLFYLWPRVFLVWKFQNYHHCLLCQCVGRYHFDASSLFRLTY